MKTSYSRGKIGERKVMQILNKLNKGKYSIFNNITFEYEGKTVEIDHLIVSNFGVYIIETKHISGKVKGNSTDKYWVKLKNKVVKFYNPIIQNDIHIKAFKHKIGEYTTYDVPIYSLVVFVNSNVETDAVNVINETDLITMIFKLNKQQLPSNIKNKLVELIT